MCEPSFRAFPVSLLETQARAVINVSDVGTHAVSFLVAATAVSLMRPRLNSLLDDAPASEFCLMMAGGLRRMAVIVRLGGLADAILLAYAEGDSALTVLGSLCEVWCVEDEVTMCNAFLRWATTQIETLRDHVQIVPVVPRIGIVIPADGVHAVCAPCPQPSALAT